MRTLRLLGSVVSAAVAASVVQLVTLTAPAHADTVPKDTWPATGVLTANDRSSNFRADDALAHATFRDGNGLYLANLANGNRRTLASDPNGGGYDHAVISGDGSTVVSQWGPMTVYPHTHNQVTVLRGFDPSTLQGGTETTYNYPDDTDMRSVALSDDGSRFAYGGQGVTVVDTATGVRTVVVPPVDCPFTENQPFDWHQIALSGDGRTLATYVGANCNNGIDQARVYDITDLAAPTLLWSHDQRGEPFPFGCSPTDRTQPIDISDDGTKVAVSDFFSPSANLFHGEVLFHDLTTGTDHTYFPDQGRVCSISLSDDGDRLAAEVGDPRKTGEYQGSSDWGQSIFVTDVTPSATPVLIAEHTYVPAPYNSYSDYGWGLDGLSGDGTAVLFSEQYLYPSSYHQLWIARDPAAAALAWPSGAAVTASQVAQTFVALQWPAATGTVSSYRVTGGPGGPVDVPGGQTTATVSGLSPSTAYHFEVRARNGGTSTDPLPLDVTTAAPAGPGAAALSATVTADDTVRLQWDPKAGADGYQVLRGTGAGPVTAVADLGPGTTQWTDGTTDGATGYTYRVAALSGGAAGPHTVNSTVTTAAVAITSATLLATQSLGYAVPGAPVAVHAAGQPHRTATVQLSVQGIASPPPVTLSETGPGRYDGTLQLPAGATRLEGATVRLVDAVGTGNGHTATTSAGSGLPVGGALVLHLHTSGFQGRALASSASAGWSVTSPLDLNGDLTRLLGVPPASDITMSYLRSSDTTLLSGAAGIAAAAGQIVDLPARTLSAAASLTIDAGGDGAGALLSVTQDGSPRQVRLDQQGTAAVSGLDAGSAATIALVASDAQSWQFQTMAPVTAQLVPGANAAQIPLDARSEAALEGTIVASVSGVSMEGGTVTVVQEHGATSVSRNGKVDGTGHYEVPGLLAGVPTTVAVTQRHARSAEALPVTMVPGINHVDIPVPVIDRYFINPVLHLVDVHGGTSTEPLDFRAGAHYLASLTGPGTFIEGFGFGAGGSIAIAGQPGESVTLCANGYGWGYSRGCASVVLPASTASAVDLTLELSAEGRGNIQYALRDAVGATDLDRTVEVVASRGAQVVTARTAVTDGLLSLDPGTWGFAVLDPDTGQVLSNRPVAIQSGVDSPVYARLAPDGPFTGEGNGLVAQQQSASPGGGLDLSASWKPSNALPSGSLDLVLPSSVTVPDPAVSATVNGAPVAATLSGDTLHVPVPAVAAGGSGHATVHLDVAADADGEAVAVLASMTAGGSHPLGMVVVPMPPVTVSALPRVATHTVQVTGRAQGGSAVKVFADGIAVGSATASSSGSWRVDVILPPGDRHSLVATSNGETSEAVPVVVDRFAPSFTSVTVGQAGVRSYTREPAASYPYIVVPNLPMTVTATMADASRLASADVVVDGVHHPMTRNGDQWQATFLAGQPRGEIGIEYVEAPLPTDLTLAQLTPPKPSMEEFLSSLPPTEAQDLGTPTASVSDNGHHAKVTSPAGTLDIITSDGTGLSTVGKRQIADGVWVLVEPTLSVSGDVVSGSVTLLVHDPAVARGRTTSPGQLPPGIVPDTAVEIGFVLSTGALGGYEAYGTKDKYKKLKELLDQATGCSPGAFQEYRNKLDDLLKEAVAADAASALMQIGGLALGPETFGIATIALWATSEVYSALLDKRMDDLLKAVEVQIDSDPECPGGGAKHPPGPGSSGPGGPGRDPLARPIWIYDPSGTITDGVDPVSGATATLTRADSEHSAYSVWNAADYEQENDQLTGVDGHYGWNVPEGWYVVTATAPGRVPASSEPLQVLPPRTGIDLVLAPDHLPTVASATAAGDVVTVTFDGWMKSAFLTGSQLTLTDAGGNPVTATVAPVAARVGTDGATYAKAVTLTVAPPPRDTALTLTVGAGVQDVLGRPMADDVTKPVTVAGSPSGGGGGGPSTGCTKAQQDAAAAAATVTTATAVLATAKAALAKATTKLKKLKKAHAPAAKVKAAKKKVKAAQQKVKSAQASLATATSAAAAAAASAAAACH